VHRCEVAQDNVMRVQPDDGVQVTPKSSDTKAVEGVLLAADTQ
jgi:hypothetical protein